LCVVIVGRKDGIDVAPTVANADDFDGRVGDGEGDHCSPAVAKGPEAGADVVPRCADYGEVGEPVAPAHDRHDEALSDVGGRLLPRSVVEVPEVPFRRG